MRFLRRSALAPLLAAILPGAELASRAVLAQGSTLAPSQGSAVAQVQADPAALPAQDKHEGLLVAADPYADTERAKQRFEKVNPLQAGIVPIELFLRNETALPLRITLESLRLEISMPDGSRQRLENLTVQQVAGLMAHPGGAADPTRRRIPTPLPLPGHDKKQDKIADKLRPLALDADVVPPSATIHGFVFFNLGGEVGLLRSAELYLPDVKTIPGDKPLTYFDVDLRAASAK